MRHRRYVEGREEKKKNQIRILLVRLRVKTGLEGQPAQKLRRAARGWWESNFYSLNVADVDRKKGSVFCGKEGVVLENRTLAGVEGVQKAC